jgi:hypothetical protein
LAALAGRTASNLDIEKLSDAVLIHRDPLRTAVPAKVVQQLRLVDKSNE